MTTRARALVTKGALAAALSLGVAAPAAFAQEQQPAVGTAQAANLMATLHLGTCDQADPQPFADLGMLAPYGQMDGFGQGTRQQGGLDQGAGQDGPIDDGTTGQGAGQQGTVDQTGVDQGGAAGQDGGMVQQDGMGQNYRGTQTQGQPVLVSNLTLDTPFDEVLDPQRMHLIAIHEGQLGAESMVACGELGGFEQDGRVVVPLRSVNDSDHAGIAVLDDDDAGFLGLGEAQTQITVYLVPEATAADRGGMQQEAQAEQQDEDAVDTAGAEVEATPDTSQPEADQ